MGKTFHKIRLCCVGKVQDADKIPRWVTANGGEYTKIIDKRTTHLVTTKEAYKQSIEAVKEAMALKTVKIVCFDWLEDSLLSKSRRPLKEGPYLWENRLSSRIETTHAAVAPKSSPKKIWDPFLTNKKGAKGARGANRGQVYQEPGNGDIWKITLVRNHLPSNRQERYQLAIIQSFAKNPTYSTYAKYSRVGMSKVELLAPAQKNLPLAMKAFIDFFKGKTGKEWTDREDGNIPPPKCNEDGEPLPPHEGWYAPEINSNIFTDYLKSWQEPRVPNELEAAVRDGIAASPSHGLVTNTNLNAPDNCTGQDGPFEGLSRGHALLESLLSMEVGLCASDKQTKEGCTDGVFSNLE